MTSYRQFGFLGMVVSTLLYLALALAILAQTVLLPPGPGKSPATLSMAASDQASVLAEAPLPAAPIAAGATVAASY